VQKSARQDAATVHLAIPRLEIGRGRSSRAAALRAGCIRLVIPCASVREKRARGKSLGMSRRRRASSLFASGPARTADLSNARVWRLSSRREIVVNLHARYNLHEYECYRWTRRLRGRRLRSSPTSSLSLSLSLSSLRPSSCIPRLCRRGRDDRPILRFFPPDRRRGTSRKDS